MATTTTFDPFDPDEWVDSPGCTAFEMAIEMRAKGALAASAAPVLAVHLESCASCREYAANAGRIDGALALAPSATPTLADWSELRAKLYTRVKSARRLPWWVALGCATVFCAQALLNRHFGGRLIPIRFGLVYLAVVLATLGGITVWKVRRIERIIERPDIVAAYREDLKRSMRSTRWLVWLWQPLMIVFSGLRALGGYARFAQGDRAGGTDLALFGVATVAMTWSLWLNRRARRRAAQELAELR